MIDTVRAVWWRGKSGGRGRAVLQSGRRWTRARGGWTVVVWGPGKTGNTNRLP